MANTALITSLFSMHNAQDFANSFSLSNTSYYAFAGNHIPFPGSDANVAMPTASEHDVRFNYYNQMIFGKQLNSSDVYMSISRNDWVANTVYASYDNGDPILQTKKFYVGVNTGTEYDVFKCLNNAGGIPSTIVPQKAQTSAADNFYSTSDGYQWKYMYSLPIAIFTAFATTDFIPIIPDANVVGNATSASIDVIKVVSSSNAYSNFLSATFNSVAQIKVSGNQLIYQIDDSASPANTLYAGCYLYITTGTAKGAYAEVNTSISNSTGKYVYLNNVLSLVPAAGDSYQVSPKVVIYGDGRQMVNAYARAIVSNGFVSSVQIIGGNAGGVGYGSATANVFASPYVGVTSAKAAVLQPIISPVEGHGGNPQEELFSTSVVVGFTFANTEGNTVLASSSYRTLGIMRNPLYANVTFQVNTTAGFILGEQVTQANSGATGYITSTNTNYVAVTNAFGNFTTGNSTAYIITGVTSNTHAYISGNIFVTGVQKAFSTFDQTYRYIGTLGASGFTSDEQVYIGANVSVANAYQIFSNTTAISVTNELGLFPGSNTITGVTSGATFNINNSNFVKYPDIVFGSGDILYVQNFTPITRSNTQTETVRVVFSF